MALHELPRLAPRAATAACRFIAPRRVVQFRSSSTAIETPPPSPSADLDDLDPLSSFATPGPSEDIINAFDPVKRSQSRASELPPSRYQFRPPKYYRGPLHPHQPPPASSPTSREFVPGPFSIPRLQQTYETTIAPDLLALTYSHIPPGTPTPERAPRLRAWDNSSPYYANRAARGPRGNSVLRLLKKPTTFRTIPRISQITVHSMTGKTVTNSGYLHVAGLVLQSITGVRSEVHKSRHNVAPWGLRQHKAISVTATLRGEGMLEFLSKVVEVVLPRLKEWRGVKGSSGDSSGNISFGLRADDVAMFPEVEVNYDMYPPEMIPGCHVTVHTTATNDRDARLLLSALGVPFHGKFVD
ncbi:MAG: hypothetical protein M1829_001781 [Trizodia sp. TS-e1964]|nr:MAG: hypothetical protein M1829_001781 [Trizodia sp. TS-e1964]